MSRKKKPRGKKFPAHPDFSDRNLSSIESLSKKGSVVKSPFSEFPAPLVHRSWNDQCIPNILWACILTSFLDQADYIEIFRNIISSTLEKVEKRSELFITHNFLATASENEFDAIMDGVLKSPDAKRYLRALRLVDCLPDKSHWNRHLDEPDKDRDWQILSHAVGDNFDHQSQRSTDIRWLKLMFIAICQNRMKFPQSMEQRIEELRLYPDAGDLRSVRPFIRATEIITRMDEFGETDRNGPNGPIRRELPPLHIDLFWQEMHQKWPCLLPSESEPPERGPVELVNEVLDTFQSLEAHFHQTITTTSPDPRHDGSFGLALFGATHLLNVAHGYSHSRPEGRSILRIMVEAFITLHFLTVEDDPSLWEQYRRYGSGQAKLAFLKNIREEESPEYLDLKMMEHLANEDMWMEFEDIKIGNWANINLRTMSEKSKTRDVYDKYYDWTSGYTHGHWVCVRDTVFVNCLNSLHRFHRVPSIPKSGMPSVLSDGCKLLNRMLDDINHLYPSFKKRISWHKSK